MMQIAIQNQAVAQEKIQEKAFLSFVPYSRAHVTAQVNYVVPPLEKNVIEVPPVGSGQPQRIAAYDPKTVNIHNARYAKEVFTLDRQGFQLGEHYSEVKDFYDDEQIKRVYYPEMETLIKQATGGSQVVVFDHTVRVADNREDSRAPVKVVHNDYTPKSAPQRVVDLLGEEQASVLLQQRFSVVNVWRSIDTVVESAPLAVIDARSVGHEDLIATDLKYPDRVGEIYEVAANPDHRWFYFPYMKKSEVLFIKGHDSFDHYAKLSPHTAFDDPSSPSNAAARKSIEIRSLVFY